MIGAIIFMFPPLMVGAFMTGASIVNAHQLSPRFRRQQPASAFYDFKPLAIGAGINVVYLFIMGVVTL